MASIEICINGATSTLPEENQVVLEENVEGHLGQVEDGSKLCHVADTEIETILAVPPDKDSKRIIVKTNEDCAQAFSAYSNLEKKGLVDSLWVEDYAHILCVSHDSFAGAISVIHAGKKAEQFYETKGKLGDAVDNIQKAFAASPIGNIAAIFQPAVEMGSFPAKVAESLADGLVSFFTGSSDEANSEG